MTAMDGGERPDEGPAALDSVLERPRAGARTRPLDEIFPLRGDVDRSRLMQETWRAFGSEMAGAVKAAFDARRSPPEIAYAIGEIVHNHFRTRGVTLTSFELRRLVAELLARQTPNRAPDAAPAMAPLVHFADEAGRRNTSWTGAETAVPPRPVSDAAFEAPASALVTVTPRDTEAELLAAVTARVRARLPGADPSEAPRPAVIEAIDGVLDGMPGLPPLQRRRLLHLLLGELCGLGPIDRLWADDSVRAVLVNRADVIQVERDGVLEQAQETFRDRAHLETIVRRLTGEATSSTVTISLRDGGEAVVVLPPAAPAGPVLALRRGEPGEATLEQLVALGRLGRPMADLLRIATRSRLNVLVVGPEKAGKTALLAAIARDLGDARTVTLARHREFRWASASKIELVGSPRAPLDALLAASLRLRPDLLVVDSLQSSDAGALGDLLAAGPRGVVAAGDPQAMANAPRETIDLRVNLARQRHAFVVTAIEDATGAEVFAYQQGSGFHRRTATPSFARAVHQAGYGEALASVLR